MQPISERGSEVSAQRDEKKVARYIEKLQKKHSSKTMKDNTKSSPPAPEDLDRESRKVQEYIDRLNTNEKTVDRSARIIESSMVDTKLVQRRYILIAMSTCASFLTMALRGTMNVMLISVLGRGTVFEGDLVRNSTECPAYAVLGSAEKKEADYGEYWDDYTVAIVLSSVYIGFLASPIPGGIISIHISPRAMIASALYLSGLLSLLVPLTASDPAHYWSLILVRTIQGACLGLVLPTVTTMFSRWLPDEEISLLCAINFAGMIVGYMIGSSGSEVLAGYGPWGGWPSIFYLYGSVTEVFCCLWIYLIGDWPERHTTIHASEQEYILKSVAVQSKTTPWTKILTSGPVWASVLLVFTADWLLTELGAGIPEFVEDILNYNLSAEPVLSWIPYLILGCSTLLSAALSDFVVRRNILSITKQRKVMALAGILPTCVFLVAMNYIGCNRATAVALMMLGFASMGLTFSTAMTSALDISRHHCGLIFGMAWTMGSLANLLIPLKAASLIQTGATRDNLSKNLFATVGVAFMLALLYIVFGSGERQQWDIAEDVISIEIQPVDGLTRDDGSNKAPIQFHIEEKRGHFLHPRMRRVDSDHTWDADDERSEGSHSFHMFVIPENLEGEDAAAREEAMNTSRRRKEAITMPVNYEDIKHRLEMTEHDLGEETDDGCIYMKDFGEKRAEDETQQDTDEIQQQKETEKVDDNDKVKDNDVEQNVGGETTVELANQREMKPEKPNDRLDVEHIDMHPTDGKQLVADQVQPNPGGVKKDYVTVGIDNAAFEGDEFETIA